jgi:hypothetical protein
MPTTPVSYLSTGLLLASALLLSACSSIPQSTTPSDQFSQLECTELVEELKQAYHTEFSAEQARGDAWKVIMPIVAAVRYGDAVSKSSAAQERAALLREYLRGKGCEIPKRPPETVVDTPTTEG